MIIHEVLEYIQQEFIRMTPSGKFGIILIELILPICIYCKLKSCSEINTDNDYYDDFFQSVFTETEGNPAICDATETNSYNKDVAPHSPMELEVAVYIYEITDVDER